MRRLRYVICPKCQNVLKTVDKNGIHIEQCEGCRGIFLDRGELEQIVGAENAYYAQAAPPPYAGGAPMPPPGYQGAPAPGGHYGRPDSPRPYGGGYKDSPKPYRGGRGGYKDSPKPYRGGHGGYGDSPRPYGGGHGGHGGHPRRKRSFLENLFD
ncbi:zf-TFIIB domain-containing protein [Amycolatopsis palatopharyngis]|uniref:TFIIB-type zinc ribbon-containing protein n=1 Tax=Amycolatopsis palatopharyngis TaxID=187982 RepID=UPI000E21DE08|nr:zf-TFIIB domain-containing protein [Amycolatopsis palatopharyngis]